MPDLYVLVHPERFPSNDWDAALGELCADSCALATVEELEDFDSAYGRQLLAAADRAARAACILDGFAVEDLLADSAVDDRGIDQMSPAELAGVELCPGAPAARFELLLAEPGQELAWEAGKLACELETGSSVEVGGFARHDCCELVVRTFREHGHRVSLCELTTMPLSERGLRGLAGN